MNKIGKKKESKGEKKMNRRKEALKRIETLEKECGLNVNLAENFKKGEVLYSYVTPQKRLGRMKKLSSNKKYEQIVKKFEDKHKNYVVYHVIHSETYVGEILSILFVSDEPDEWEVERLENGYICAYCINLLYPELSEFGDIIIEGYDNGTSLKRVDFA